MRPGRRGVFVMKGVTGFDKFLAAYEKFKNYECAIHFRDATIGHINKENAHPYKVGEHDLWMMHNGHFNIPRTEPGFSDSWHFADSISFFGDKIRDPKCQEMLSSHIGNNNRILFCDNEGFIVINPKNWVSDENGVMYSNTYAWKCPIYLLKSETRIKMNNSLSERKKKQEDLDAAFSNLYDRESEMNNRDVLAEDMSIDSALESTLDASNPTDISLAEYVEMFRAHPYVMARFVQKTVGIM